LLVNAWRTITRLSKSITSARSCARRWRVNPMAASCAVESRDSMLALVSRRMDSAIGELALLKNTRSCFTPSS